ncbi:MAG: VCBS repeat-containing protein, partial [Sedimentisphaerales bacterium]|nr:VCBS repeat-containing protein [Sedimentisphaerales bacterium]
MKLMLLMLTVSALMLTPQQLSASVLNLGGEELVQAKGSDIQVAGYSVPCLADWNNDGLADLIIGEGGGSTAGKVRIYLDVGTSADPQFSGYFYAQSNGTDLAVPASGCLGCFPRVVYWDADERKDLLVGLGDGTVKIYLNTGTDENPTFDSGTNVLVNVPGASLNVGARATPTFVDWNSDGMNDLVVGGLDGKIHIYLNCGCAWPIPAFYYSVPIGEFAKENDQDLVVPSARSSPIVLDLDGDGKKDLLTGNTEGELLLYINIGTDAEPKFSGCLRVESGGVPINLAGTPRSRPFVCDWTGDGYLDVLVGAGDGKVHLYQSKGQVGDIDKDYDVDFIDFAWLSIFWQKT